MKYDTNIVPLVFKKYFDSKEDASLSDFVEKHKDFIIENHRLGQDMPSIWTKYFERAYKEYYRESTPLGSSRRPNWGALALGLVKVRNAYHDFVK